MDNIVLLLLENELRNAKKNYDTINETIGELVQNGYISGLQKAIDILKYHNK